MLLSYIKDIKDGRIVTRDALAEIDFQGIPIVIENKEGSIRTGEDEDGTKFRTKMFYPYGFIKNTEGTDGDEIDCFIGPDKSASKVFVIFEKVTGEDKCMLGFSEELHARDAFLAHYDEASHLGKITKMPIEDFKQAIKKHRKGTPITDAKLDTDIAQQIERLRYRIESYQILLRGGTVQKGSVAEGRYRGHIYDLKEQIAELKRQARNK